MQREVTVALCRNEEWKDLRECWVRAFARYPLYQHLIRNDAARPAFLRNYLDAIYEVTVRRGTSLPICIKVSDGSRKRVIIGGVLFVPPCSRGGWECAKDEEFYDAYERYELRKIDEDSFNRIKRYEEWEYENITKRICRSKIPMWNGILCGIDPYYASKGRGSVSYKKCLLLLQNQHNAIFNTSPSYSATDQIPFETLTRRLSGLFKSEANNAPSLFVKLLHSFSVLSHRAPVIPDFSTLQTANGEPTLSRCPTPAVLFAISHSSRSSHFHKSNGFTNITETSYRDGCCENELPTTVTAMVMELPYSNSTTKGPIPRVIPCMTAGVGLLDEGGKEKDIELSTLFRVNTNFENICV